MAADCNQLNTSHITLPHIVSETMVATKTTDPVFGLSILSYFRNMAVQYDGRERAELCKD